MLENLRYMKSLLENDKKMIAEYNARIEKLRGLEGSLEKDASRKETIKTSIELKKNEIETEKKKKAIKLVQVKQDKKNYQTSLLELEANARRLQSIVERLEARSKKQRQAKETEVRSSKKPASVTPPVSDKGFGSQRGRLFMPVKGKIISSFGKHKHPQFNSYTMNNGISIATPSGSDVHAVYEGKVIFAEYFKGYGNMVIVDHGGGYFSLYAHNANISKKVGTNVGKNDILATAGDVDSPNGPMLYFEIRYQGKPIDPTPWVR
jgi:septal ring factor EnvC (AmiA/AmiB activator)